MILVVLGEHFDGHARGAAGHARLGACLVAVENPRTKQGLAVDDVLCFLEALSVGNAPPLGRVAGVAVRGCDQATGGGGHNGGRRRWRRGARRRGRLLLGCGLWLGRGLGLLLE